MNSIVILDCPCCKHCYENFDVSTPLFCDAFPKGIPKEYLFGPIQVTELKECNKGYKYEEVDTKE